MKTAEEIYQQMRADFAARAGFLPAEGSECAVRLYALAAQVQALSAQADWVLAQSFPQTAQGSFLDSHAATRGLSRTSGVKAKGLLRFFASEGASLECAIPKGAVCMTASGIRFETTQAATLGAGEEFVDVPASALEAGALGNVAAGTVTRMALPPVGIRACSNAAPFAGGSEEESDSSLRMRILESFARLPNGANAAYYEREALSHPLVVAAKAVGRARGLGTVDVTLASADGAPAQAVLDEVAEALSKKREIAVDLRVSAPTLKTVNVSAAVKAQDFAAVKARVETALRGFFTGEKLGKSVYIAQLIALIASVEGVENCALSAPAADLVIAETELAMLGTLTVTEME